MVLQSWRQETKITGEIRAKAGGHFEGKSGKRVMTKPQEKPATGEAVKPTGLTTEIQARIGHQLRAMYDEVVRQGVPDRFAELVRRLDGPSAEEGEGRTKEAEGSD